jgi:hypothetical protein
MKDVNTHISGTLPSSKRHIIFYPPKKLWRDMVAVLYVFLSTMLPTGLLFGGLTEKEPAETVRPLRVEFWPDS